MDVVNSYEKVKPEILFSNQFTTFEAQYDFEIDLVEYGKQLTNNSCPTTKSFAYIKYSDVITSIKESLKIAVNKEEVIKNAKKINIDVLVDSQIQCYEKGNVNKVIDDTWEIPTKNFSIVIEKLQPQSQLNVEKIELYMSTKNEVSNMFIFIFILI